MFEESALTDLGDKTETGLCCRNKTLLNIYLKQIQNEEKPREENRTSISVPSVLDPAYQVDRNLKIAAQKARCSYSGRPSSSGPLQVNTCNRPCQPTHLQDSTVETRNRKAIQAHHQKAIRRSKSSGGSSMLNSNHVGLARSKVPRPQEMGRSSVVEAKRKEWVKNDFLPSCALTIEESAWSSQK